MHWQTAGPNFHHQQDLHRVSHDFEKVVFRARVCCGKHPLLDSLTRISVGRWRWRHADGPQEWIRLFGFSVDPTNPGRAWITRPHMSLTTMSLNVLIATPELSEPKVTRSQESKDANYSAEADRHREDNVLPRPDTDEQHVDVAWFVDLWVTPECWEGIRYDALVRRSLSSWRRKCWWQTMAMASAAWREGHGRERHTKCLGLHARTTVA